MKSIAQQNCNFFEFFGSFPLKFIICLDFSAKKKKAIFQRSRP